jgi:hypothetical protein
MVPTSGQIAPPREGLLACKNYQLCSFFLTAIFAQFIPAYVRRESASNRKVNHADVWICAGFDP